MMATTAAPFSRGVRLLHATLLPMLGLLAWQAWAGTLPENARAPSPAHVTTTFLKAVELAKAQGFDALVGKATQITLERAMEKGFGGRDTAVLMKLREDELGIKVRPAKT